MGGGEIGIYNCLRIFRRPKFCHQAKLASCIVDVRARVKLVLQVCVQQTWDGHTADYLINNALICPSVRPFSANNQYSRSAGNQGDAVSSSCHFRSTRLSSLLRIFGRCYSDNRMCMSSRKSRFPWRGRLSRTRMRSKAV